MLALFLILLCVWGQFWYARPGYFDFDNGFCLTCSGFLFGRTHHPHNVCLFIHSSYNSHRLLLYFCISSKLLTLLCSSLSWIYSASFCSLLVQLQISLLETTFIYSFFSHSLHFPFPISLFPFLLIFYLFEAPCLPQTFSEILFAFKYIFWKEFLFFAYFNPYSTFRYVQFITWTTMKICVHLKFLKERENLFLPSVWTLGL